MEFLCYRSAIMKQKSLLFCTVEKMTDGRRMEFPGYTACFPSSSAIRYLARLEQQSRNIDRGGRSKERWDKE
jgi:hypothetical protein